MPAQSTPIKATTQEHLDIEDIRDMEEELEKYRANPESAIDLTEYLRQKKVHVPS